jgi:hypothetical protein
VTDAFPEFRWTPLDPGPFGPLTYEVQVLNATTRQVVETLRPGSGTTVRVQQPLQVNTPFRWRVITRTAAAPAIADTAESLGNFQVASTTQPQVTLLYQNFPNPFPRDDQGVTSTRIWFDLSEPSTVELAVYDVRGRLVRQLIPATPSCGPQSMQPGLHGRTGGIADPCILTEWDGADGNGRQVPRGVYILRLRAVGAELTRRMLYLPSRS